MTSLALLASCPLFAALSDSDRAALSHAFQRRQYFTGERVITAGQRAQGLVLVERGCLDVDLEGRHVRSVAAGGFYAELAPLLAGGLSPLSVTAREASVLHIALMASLDTALMEDPGRGARFYRTVAKAMADRLCEVYADPGQLRRLLS